MVKRVTQHHSFLGSHFSLDTRNKSLVFDRFLESRVRDTCGARHWVRSLAPLSILLTWEHEIIEMASLSLRWNMKEKASGSNVGEGSPLVGHSKTKS